MQYLSQPLAGNPAVDHLEGGNGLIVRDHVATTIDSQESEVAAALDGSSGRTVQENVILEGSLLEVLVAGPLESLGPGLVSKPVADIVQRTSVDQDRDLLEDTGYKTVEGLHPVTGEEEVSVNVEVARVVLADLGTESLHDLRSVEVLADPVELIVAQAVAAALLGDVVRVAASLLVRTDHGVVAVDGGRNT